MYSRRDWLVGQSVRSGARVGSSEKERSMATVTVPSSTEQISYEDLYARWEKGNWRATEIDFSQDREDWRHRLS